MPVTMKRRGVLIDDALKKFFEKRNEINTALLFGSFAKKRITPHSDIDIGILLKTYVAPPFEYVASLSVELDKICERETDVIVLNQVSPHIAYRAISEGKIIFQRNQSFWSRFVVKTISMNEEMEILYAKVRHG